MKRFIRWLLSALYGLVMIEVIIMISPFAFYWYSLYAPTLQGLHRWRATAWMEAFFLPHSVITTSPILEFLRWQAGAYAFSLGILGFLFCAAQIYGAKLRKKGVVHSIIYSRIRHPQYLCLAVAGFGLLTIWPRIIILIFYLGMLFAYYFLACFEETQMGAKDPSYADYRKRTAMFIPGNPGGKLWKLLFGWIPSRKAALAVSSGVLVAVAIGGGLLLRHYTIGHSATDLLTEDRVFAIATWPMPEEDIQQVVSVALQDHKVREALDQNQGAGFVAHLLPADYGMINMFADVGTDHRMFTKISPGRFKYLLSFIFPFAVPRLRSRIMGTPMPDYKVVFSSLDAPGLPVVRASQAADLSVRMTPVVIVEIQGSSPAVKEVIIPPRRSFWGDITMPMF